MRAEYANAPEGDTPEAAEDFFTGLDRSVRLEHEAFDLYTSAADESRPAVVFIHGGPLPEGQTPTPRHSPTFTGYGALAASAGLVGVTFDHPLHTAGHYPSSAEEISDVIDQARRLPQIDSDRVTLWFFSGGGALAADWLRALPSWLRGIVWTYPVLAPPPDWPGDAPRFDCTRAVIDAPELPKLLIRVSGEYPSFRDTQDAAVEAAQVAHSILDIIDLPEATHGYEALGYEESARQGTDRAMSWVAEMTYRQ